MIDSTRRELLKALGAAGTATTVGAGVATAEDDSPEIGDVVEKIDDGIETARVRVGHFSPDAPPVDVYAYIPGYRSLGEVSVETDLSFSRVRPALPANYTNVPAMPLGIRITPAGEPEETLCELSRVKPEAGRNYTFLAIGELAPEQSQPEFQVLSLVDNASETPPRDGATMLPSPDETLIRVVHAESEAAAVTVRSGAERLSAVKFGETTGYRTVDPERPLVLTGRRRSGSGAGTERLATITEGLRPGHAYTVYVVEDPPEVGAFTPTVTATVDAVARPRIRTDD